MKRQEFELQMNQAIEASAPPPPLLPASYRLSLMFKDPYCSLHHAKSSSNNKQNLNPSKGRSRRRFFLPLPLMQTDKPDLNSNYKETYANTPRFWVKPVDTSFIPISRKPVLGRFYSKDRNSSRNAEMS